MATMGYVSKGENFIRMSVTLSTAKANLYFKWYYKKSGAGSWLYDGQTSSTSTTTYYTNQYYGLESGTWYDFKCEIYNGSIYYDGASYGGSIQTDKTPTPPAYGPSMSATTPVWNESSQNFSCTLYYNQVADATSYTFYANNNSGSGDVYKGSGSTSGSYIFIVFDSPNTTYTIKGISSNAYGSSNASIIYVTTGAKPDTTPPTMLDFQITQITANTCTVMIRAVDYESGLYRFVLTLNGYDNRYVYSIDGNGYGYGTFDGLTVNTQYDFGAYAQDQAGNSSVKRTIRSKTVYARPANWSWWTYVGSGGAISITAAEWNAFTARINLFRQWWDSTRDTGMGQYPFTTVYTGTKITAAIYNQARNAIATMTTNGLYGTLASGTRFNAAYIDSLRVALNSLPAS